MGLDNPRPRLRCIGPRTKATTWGLLLQKFSRAAWTWEGADTFVGLWNVRQPTCRATPGAVRKSCLHLPSVVPPRCLLFHSHLSMREMRLSKHSPGLGKGCTALQMWIRDRGVDTSEKDHRYCVLCAVSHALKNRKQAGGANLKIGAFVSYLLYCLAHGMLYRIYPPHPTHTHSRGSKSQRQRQDYGEQGKETLFPRLPGSV